MTEAVKWFYWLNVLVKLSHTRLLSCKLFSRCRRSKSWLCIKRAYPYTSTLWSRELLKMPLVVQLLEIFPIFYGTRRFSTVFTRALIHATCPAHLTLLDLIVLYKYKYKLWIYTLCSFVSVTHRKLYVNYVLTFSCFECVFDILIMW
jgi:hypothetical protein